VYKHPIAGSLLSSGSGFPSVCATSYLGILQPRHGNAAAVAEGRHMHRPNSSRRGVWTKPSEECVRRLIFASVSFFMARLAWTYILVVSMLSCPSDTAMTAYPRLLAVRPSRSRVESHEARRACASGWSTALMRPVQLCAVKNGSQIASTGRDGHWETS
jgi:hypothetical protein